MFPTPPPPSASSPSPPPQRLPPRVYVSTTPGMLEQWKRQERKQREAERIQKLQVQQQQQKRRQQQQAQAEGLALPVAESHEAGHQTEEDFDSLLQEQLARLRRSWNHEMIQQPTAAPART